MAIEVVMPRLGWTMETAVFGEWLKKDGDEVRAGDVLFSVETDKATQEVEAVDGGILRLPPDAAAPGAEVAVGALLAYLAQPGEATPFETHLSASALTPPDARSSPPSQAYQAYDVGGRVPAARRVDASSSRIGAPATAVASPRARRVARELGVDWTALTGSGRGGRIVERDVRMAAQGDLAPGDMAEAGTAPSRITPLARRAAAHNGVDVDGVAARMAGRRIMRADVEAASRPAEPAIEADAAVPVGRSGGRPLGRVRRIIAERMTHSVRTAASVTLTTEADTTELAALRTRIKEALSGSDKPVPSYTDLVTRLTALALLDHPWMNSSLVGDAIVQHDAAHIGIAVDTAQGLLAPVLRDAHLKSLQRIASESAGLIARARAGESRADDFGGGTFSITNLGMYEIDAFTPIINQPECAILGLGRAVARYVVTDADAGAVAVRTTMALSLTFDHRLVDGAPAARFLQQIKRWIEQPYGWLTA